MAQLTVTVNGRRYDLQCGDGQESHLRELVRLLNQRLDRLVASVGQVGEGRLLLLTALFLQDELVDLQAQANGQERQAGLAWPGTAHGVDPAEDLVVALESFVARIEQVAERLEHA
jgi:cell division protein ZapA